MSYIAVLILDYADSQVIWLSPCMMLYLAMYINGPSRKPNIFPLLTVGDVQVPISDSTRAIGVQVGKYNVYGQADQQSSKELLFPTP